MNELRLDPAFGRLAERIPVEFARDDYAWFTYRWEEGRGLTVEALTAKQVADWPRMILVDAKPSGAANSQRVLDSGDTADAV